MTTERVPFRLIQMPCCEHLFCNVNNRLPSYCPACGTFVFDQIKGCVIMSDNNAVLKYKMQESP